VGYVPDEPTTLDEEQDREAMQTASHEEEASPRCRIRSNDEGARGKQSKWVNVSLRPRPAAKIIQFNWRRHWKKKVEPYLEQPLVRGSVEMGMKLCDPKWKWEYGPHSIGKGHLFNQRVVRGKLSWYQPLCRCHWISFFSCAIGVLNYPELDWQFISGDYHTVPVGSWNGQYRVVMDILRFREETAEEAIAFAQRIDPDYEYEDDIFPGLFSFYIQEIVPRLRELAQGGQASPSTDSAVA
jgi:hypothetical protein